MATWNNAVREVGVALQDFKREIREMVHDEQFKAALTISKAEIILFGKVPRTARKANS